MSETKESEQYETACPACGGVAFVIVQNSGHYSNAIEGEVHWFYGEGQCIECPWKGEISDSS